MKADDIGTQICRLVTRSKKTTKIWHFWVQIFESYSEDMVIELGEIRADFLTHLVKKCYS